MERYLMSQVQKDLAKKMVFLGGPRQVGKTTLARTLIEKGGGVMLNWDIPAERTAIIKREIPQEKFIVFDELHKFRRWRGFLKGIFDEYGKKKQILVTGSARLDYYRFGGDSLQGRYHYLRLHPLSVAELGGGESCFRNLLNLGGFPEPFFSSSRTEADRWSLEYRSRIIQEDIRLIEELKDISSLETLSVRLPDLVGSPLSINNLHEDLDLGYKVVRKGIEILERLYHIFRVPPFGAPRIRAVKKEQKHYHFDWNLIEEPGVRFENLVACHLLKWVHFNQDVKGQAYDLRYFRDIDGREVDFVLMLRSKPIHFIECKLKDTQISKGLYYLKERFPDVMATQLVGEGVRDFQKDGIRVTPAWKFLGELV